MEWITIVMAVIKIFQDCQDAHGEVDVSRVNNPTRWQARNMALEVARAKRMSAREFFRNRSKLIDDVNQQAAAMTADHIAKLMTLQECGIDRLDQLCSSAPSSAATFPQFLDSIEV